MTTAAPPPPTPAPVRRGYHVPTWVGVVVGAFLLGFAVLAFGVAVGRHRDRGFGDGRLGRFGDHVGDGHHWGFWLLVILLAIAGIALLVAALRKARSAAPTDGSPTTAEQILAERFARGEIDEADFRARRDALRA